MTSPTEITLLRKDFLTLVSRVEMLEFKLSQLLKKDVPEKKDDGKYDEDDEETNEEPVSLLSKKKKGDKKQ